ncbi:hypothetical protein AVEN_256393-1 [Araneus ventricosus]|uniref:Uncharacterized protein n=1 Tax=Araneus ventricosus TaxID=182803 RepID=A0A4Y2FY81_ARAVE|nr:hypothetical protein AVEN_256393-1 [Araneus ventricosus]
MIPKAIEIKGPQNTGTSEFLYERSHRNHNDSWHCPNCKKTPLFPEHNGRTTLTNKALAVCVKSIERMSKFQSDIRTAIVFCLKGRMGRSRIDRVNGGVSSYVDRGFQTRLHRSPPYK